MDNINGKKSILILTDYYTPGFKAGGGITAVENFCGWFRNNFQISIITRDHDMGEKKKYPSLISNSWIKNDVRLYYSSNILNTLSLLIKCFLKKEIQYLYLQSFFSFQFSILPIFLSKITFFHGKIIIATRGELLENALYYKKNKKTTYINLCKLFSVYRNIIFQATSTDEINSLQKYFPDCNKELIEDLPKYINQDELKFKKSVKDTGLKMLYLGRISSHKNLLKIIDVLKKNVANITLDIYGFIDEKASPGYWNKCLDIIHTPECNQKVKYIGTIMPSEVLKTIAKYDLLVMISKSENYGHAILESFLAGRPVLIGTKTPWNNLYSKKVGMNVNVDSDSEIITALNTFSGLNVDEHNDWCRSAFEFGTELLKNNKLVDKYSKFFI